MQKTMWYFGTMHITLRMTIMLSIVGAFYKKRTTQQKSKIDRPFTEGSIDLQRCQSLSFKTEINQNFGRYAFTVNVTTKRSQYLPC